MTYKSCLGQDGERDQQQNLEESPSFLSLPNAPTTTSGFFSLALVVSSGSQE